MSDLIEIRLDDFNWSRDGHYEIMKELAAVLQTDPKWHFFWEGAYSLVRCTEESVPHVSKLLASHNVNFEVKGKWEDNIWVTKKYQHVFEDMFHAFSVMAWEMDYDDLKFVLDRVVHCFLNNCTSPQLIQDMEKKHGDWGRLLYESYLLQDAALKRAYVVNQMFLKVQQGSE